MTVVRPSRGIRRRTHSLAVDACITLAYPNLRARFITHLFDLRRGLPSAATLHSLFLRDAGWLESNAAYSMDHIQTPVFNSARRRGHVNLASSDSSDNHGSTSGSSASSSSLKSKHPPISLTRSGLRILPPSSFSDLTSQKRAPESLTIDSSLTVPDSTSRNPSPGGWAPFVVVTPNSPGTTEGSASPQRLRRLLRWVQGGHL
ncbi:hypothetical protein BDZ89DRAFT_713197 [Hymenopellis radicata]|nr:hypothetical protein BDZ89DRAFT_713197 [Hymenopellis radicata]